MKCVKILRNLFNFQTLINSNNSKIREMKNLFRNALVLSCFTLTFMSCNDDDDNSSPEILTVTPDMLNLTVGDIDSVKVTNGIPNYAVISADSTIATATIANDVVKIKGVKEGEVEITVSDKIRNTAKVSVTVKADEEVEQK